MRSGGVAGRLLAAGIALVACRAQGRELPSSTAIVLESGTSTSAVVERPDAGAVATADPSSRPVAADWCIDGLTPLDDETCYVLADATLRRPAVLLVYLHGIVPPVAESEQKSRVELAVVHAAKRAGAAALVPRGLRGIGPTGAHDWWAWPTDASSHAKYAPRLVAKWADARRRLEAIAGSPFARTYLAGSSNGAYFLTALALSGDLDRLGFPVDGYAAISGGSVGGHVRSSLPAPRPFYVGYGAYDASTNASSRALGAFLGRAGWPTRISELPVGHGAREEYLDEAFAFWASEAR